MNNTEKIKGKIKALLSKTIDNGATKEEMESALQKANELMTAFFISEHDLKDESIINKCVSKSFDIVKSGFDISHYYADLAFLFECEFYFSKSKITFFGYETDVALCGYFYEMIGKTCLLEKSNFTKSVQYKILSHKYHGRSLSANFIKGFLLEIIYKMQEMYKDRQSNIPESYGLMVVQKTEKVKEEFLKLALKIGFTKPKEIANENLAFEYGREAGEKLKLIQGLDGKKEELLIEFNAL